MRTLKLVQPILTEDEVAALHTGYEDSLNSIFGDLEHHTSDWCGEKTLSVTFTIEKSLWDEYRRNRQGLGALYGIDLCNYLSRKGILNEYAVPTVSDRDRAHKGRKTIRVTYRLRGI